MIEDAIQRSKLFWRFIYDYQPLIAGLSALLAAFTTALILGYQSHLVAEEGKRDRAFRMNQHEIEMQNKRYAAAVMVAAEMRSVAQTVGLKLLAEDAKQYAEEFENLDEDGGELPTLFFYPPVYKSFLNNYSYYIENMPLMRIETVLEVSQFYLYTAKLSEAIAFSNATMEGYEINETRKNFLISISYAAEDAQNQFELTWPLLLQEIEEAQKELNRLNGVKEKSDTSAP